MLNKSLEIEKARKKKKLTSRTIETKELNPRN
jgi:hypothetical protein